MAPLSENLPCGGIITTPSTPPASIVGLIPKSNAAYSQFGTLFHSPFNFDGTSPGDVYLATSTTNNVWRSTSSSNGPLNRVALWASGPFPVDTWLGFTFCVSVPETKIYWIGLAGDNNFRIAIDGVTIVNTVGGPYDGDSYAFKYWHIYPVNLNAGSRIVELFGLNNGGIAGFGCEIYNNTIHELTGATQVSDLNIIFSSAGQTEAEIVQDLSGQYLDSGYSCPAGYTFDPCSDSCFQVQAPCATEYTYFKYCCSQNGKPEDDYFGVLTDPGIFLWGQTYLIGVSSISACTTVVSSNELPGPVNIYQNTPYTYESYSTCRSCTGATVGCSTTPKPTPTIFFTSDTRCGDNILKRNECDPIVIFPLGVSCFGVNPELSTQATGELSLVITGGTPPYNVFWSNGSNGLYINNLSVGSYSAVVTDFYGDFTAYTTCTLTAPTPMPTETVTPTPTPTPEGEPFCLTITTGDYIPLTYQYYFYPISGLLNDRTQYTDGNGHDIVWTLGTPGYWNLENPPTAYDIITYDIPDPPLTGWQILDGPVGNITSNLGECPGYPNLCLYFYQIKDATSTTIYTEQLIMVYNGTVNGRPSWLSTDGLYTISWNSSYWQVVTSEPLWWPMRSNNTQIPPLSNWNTVGATDPSNVVTVSQGNCVQAMTTTSNNTATSNEPAGNRSAENGNILLKASSGPGPYQYSIDGGLTYKSIPLFTKLLPGTYSTVVKDASGKTTFETIVLTAPPKPIVYQVRLETTQTKQKNNSTLYNSVIKISPSLPSGVTITFDLIHNNTFKSSTGETSASLINSSLMKMNGKSSSADTLSTLTSTTLNTIAGCQKDFVYITGKTETWTSVKYSNLTTLSFETTTSVIKNITNKCYIGEATDNFVITNLTISGCTNCSVVNGLI